MKRLLLSRDTGVDEARERQRGKHDQAAPEKNRPSRDHGTPFCRAGRGRTQWRADYSARG